MSGAPPRKRRAAAVAAVEKVMHDIVTHMCMTMEPFILPVCLRWDKRKPSRKQERPRQKKMKVQRKTVQREEVRHSRSDTPLAVLCV